MINSANQPRILPRLPKKPARVEIDASSGGAKSTVTKIHRAQSCASR